MNSNVNTLKERAIRDIQESKERICALLTEMHSHADDSIVHDINADTTDEEYNNPIINSIISNNFKDQVDPLLNVDGALLDGLVNDAVQGIEIVEKIDHPEEIKEVASFLGELETYFDGLSMDYGVDVKGMQQNISLQAANVEDPIAMLSGSVWTGAKNIIAKIIQMFKDAINWIGRAFKKLHNSSVSTRAKAQKLRKNCITLPIVPLTQLGAIRSAELAKQLAIKSQSPSSLTNEANKTIDILSGFIDPVLSKGLSDQISLLETINQDTSKLVYDQTKIMQEASLTIRGQEITGQGHEWYSEQMLGDMVLARNIPTKIPTTASDDGVADVVKWLYLNPTNLKKNANYERVISVEVAYLDKDQILKMLVMVEKLTDIVDKFNGGEGQLTALAKRVEKAIIASKEEVGDLANIQRSLALDANRWMVKIPTQIAAYSLRLAKNLLRLCMLSAERHYEVEKK